MEPTFENTQNSENMNNNCAPVRKTFWQKLGDAVLGFFDLASFFLLALGIVLCIRFFIFSPFTVVGQSMEPTFHGDDFIIIDKVSSQKLKLQEWYSQSWGSDTLKKSVINIAGGLPSLHRGDIVVFVPPGKDIHFIKRVIWLPGETVSIINNTVNICKTGSDDCFVLDESAYLKSDIKTVAACGVSTFDVKDGLFVMGDNREHSTDSRCCFTIGCFGDEKAYNVPYNYIIWKVRARVIPDFTKF